VNKTTTPVLQLNKAHWPVTVLGPGRRIGLWLQGCGIRCPGCVSQDTWSRDAGKALPVSDLLVWCKRVSANAADGVTISGGEPFEQPEGLASLLAGLHDWRRSAGLDFDILCYSGYPLRVLERKHGGLLRLLDAVIPEPFVEALPLDRLWRGSSNQPLVPLTALGRMRYAPYIAAHAEAVGKRMQTAVEGGRIWMIGIPARGDMERIEALCASRGLKLEGVSWRR
jgi:anaerobic ribonucleoside-triphosphate reductase activating protein